MKRRAKEPSYMMEQNRIDQRQDAFRIMQTLIRFQHPDDGLLWTSETIGYHLSDLEPWRANEAIIWLLRRGYIEPGRRRQWLKTLAGEEWFSQETKRSAFDTGAAAREFSNEALTGTDELGHQSMLTRAALPSQSRQYEHRNRVEEDSLKTCLLANHIRAIAAKLGRSVEATTEALKSGQIHRCNRCGDEYAWFHRANESNGKRWKSMCVECRREQRRRRSGR